MAVADSKDKMRLALHAQQRAFHHPSSLQPTPQLLLLPVHKNTGGGGAVLVQRQQNQRTVVAGPSPTHQNPMQHTTPALGCEATTTVYSWLTLTLC
mgnify:CR=1 FL=1